jgi:hypothetical protein
MPRLSVKTIAWLRNMPRFYVFSHILSDKRNIAPSSDIVNPPTITTGSPHDHTPRQATPVSSIPHAPPNTRCGPPTLAKGPITQFPRSATTRAHLTHNDFLHDPSIPPSTPTSMGTTIPQRPPEWELMLIGILPPPAVGYSTPTHLRPLKDAIHAHLIHLGNTPDFPLDLIPPRDQYPLFHDLLHDFRAQRDNAERALCALYTNNGNGHGYVPQHVKAEEKRLLTLVNDLNRAMFAIRYQSLEQPPATPASPLSTPLRGRDMTTSTMHAPPSEQAHTHMSASVTSPTMPTRQEGNHSQPERHPRAHVRRRPDTEPYNIAVNANPANNTITSTDEHTSNRGADNITMRPARQVTTAMLTTDEAPNADSRTSASVENVSESSDDQQDD